MPDSVLRSTGIEVQARSVSRTVWEYLGEVDSGLPSGRVLAVFERACHLAFHSGELAALVSPEIGDGPLNIVLGERPDAFPAVGAPVQVRPRIELLQSSRFRVTFDGVSLWEPRPDWERLRAGVLRLQGRLPYLRALALMLAPQDSLTSILTQASHGQQAGVHDAPWNAARTWSKSIASVVSDAARLLSLGWAGDRARLTIAAVQLTGLGSGLTPSGDDFLVGVMIWAWLAHPAPEWFCDALVEGSQRRTTELSAALLRAASKGECSMSWHLLLDALHGGSDGELDDAVRAVLDVGHTSGADALAGFIWMGLRSI